MKALEQGNAVDRRPILVTGGCGFIGSNLADALAKRGMPVIALDSMVRPGARENAAWLQGRHANLVEVRRGDIRDAEMVRSCVVSASAVLHLAGQVAVTTSIDEPSNDFEVNARGTLNVLEAVRTLNPDAAVVFASTNKVYGRVLGQTQVWRRGERYVPGDPSYERGVDESTQLDFHSPYGCSKGAADQYVRDYARVFGLRTAVMRMSCIYGPRQFGTEDQGWIAHFFLRALRNQPITIFGDGFQLRDALHVDDAVAAWLAVLEHMDSTRGEVFNLGGGAANTISLRELLNVMGEAGRRPSLVQYRAWRAGDQPWYVSDTTGLTRKTAWQSHISLHEGLRSLDDWLQFRFGMNGAVPALAGMAS